MWINAGKLLLIAPETLGIDAAHGKQLISLLQLQDAHDLIRENPTKLLYSPPIEREAFYRLEKYPQQVKDSLHHALVMLPRKLAYILHHDETCINAAIEAFYLRDPIALRPLQATSSTGLLFPPEDFVTMSVKFTKVGYAQLKSQQFSAPTSWSKAISSNNNMRVEGLADLGMKLSCGFEMLMSDPQNKDKRQVREIALLLEDVDNGQDHLPSRAEMEAWSQREDDEGWLNINFEDLEKELGGQKVYGSSHRSDGFGDKVAQDNLRRMVGRMEDFLKDDAAGVDGAEFLDELGSDEDNGEDEMSSQGSHSGSVDDEIDFDEEKFTTMMREMMGLAPKKERKNMDQAVEKGKVSSLGRDAEDIEIIETARAIEGELRDAGALRLDYDDHLKVEPLHDSGHGEDQEALMQSSSAVVLDERTGEDVDIDLNLAANLLESFKGQVGDSGPSGNLIGLMGIRMPRDEDGGPRRP